MSDLVLEGRGTCLRRMRSEDAAPLFAYRSLPEVSRYQDWVPTAVEEAHALALEQTRVDPATPGTWLQFIICRREDGEMVGDCGVLFPREERRSPELGIALHPDHHRRGYATAATRLMVDYLFGRLDVHRVQASCDPRNLPAIAVLNRLGFRQEGHLRRSHWSQGRWTDNMIFGILSEEWARERSAQDA